MSKATYYVFSTLTSSMEYTTTAPGGGDLPQTTAKVFIAGGSNLPDKYLRTPVGVMTPVTDEELSLLRDNEVFKLHEANGFMKVQSKPAEPEKVAADMVTRDQSAPTVDADFEKAPITNAPEPPPAPPASTRAHGRKA